MRGRKLLEKQIYWKRWTDDDVEKEPAISERRNWKYLLLLKSLIQSSVLCVAEKRRETEGWREPGGRGKNGKESRGEERRLTETICFCHFLARSIRYGRCYMISTHLLLFLLLLLLFRLPHSLLLNFRLWPKHWHWVLVWCPWKVVTVHPVSSVTFNITKTTYLKHANAWKGLKRGPQ